MQLLNRFKSIFTQPERPKTTEEQIGELVNKLILKLKADGKSIERKDITENHGILYVYVQNLGTDEAEIRLTAYNGWNIEVKPIFNKF